MSEDETWGVYEFKYPAWFTRPVETMEVEEIARSRPSALCHARPWREPLWFDWSRKGRDRLAVPMPECPNELDREEFEFFLKHSCYDFPRLAAVLKQAVRIRNELGTSACMYDDPHSLEG